MLHDYGFEVGAADLLFELPEKRNVDRDSGLTRRQCAQQRRYRRTFIVGRAAASILLPVITLDGELKRIGTPIVAVARSRRRVSRRRRGLDRPKRWGS
jgi:hypothetical protein